MEGIVGLKLNCKDISEILDAVELEGKDESGNKKKQISDFILFIVDKNVKINVVTGDDTLALDVEITPMKIYGTGSIPINIESFRVKLGRFKAVDDISIYYDKNESILTLMKEKPKVEVSFEATNIENITSTRRHPLPIEFKDEIPSYVKGRENDKKIMEDFVARVDVESSGLNDIIKDSDLASLYVFPIKIENRQLIAQIRNEKGTFKALREIEIETIKQFKDIKKLESTYGPNFTNLFMSLSGKLRFYMTNNSPLFLIKESKNYTIKAFLMNSSVEIDETSSNEGTEEIEVEKVT
jgi:hypothetical protein